MKGFTESGSGLSLKDRNQLNRDDRVHGSLLIMIELFMNCVLKAEVIIQCMLFCAVNLYTVAVTTFT